MRVVPASATLGVHANVDPKGLGPREPEGGTRIDPRGAPTDVRRAVLPPAHEPTSVVVNADPGSATKTPPPAQVGGAGNTTSTIRSTAVAAVAPPCTDSRTRW